MTEAEQGSASLQKQFISVHKLPSTKATVSFTIGAKIFYFAVAVYPYMFIWNLFCPITVGPVHLAILIPSLLLFLAAILQPAKLLRKLGSPVVAVLSFGIVLLLVQIVFGLTSMSSLPLMRVLYTVPLFWSLYVIYVDNCERRQTVRRIIIWNCSIAAIFGAVQFLFFPHGGREFGFLGGANVHANFLVLGLMAISTLKRSAFNSLLAIVLFVFLTLAASRWAVVIAIIMLYKILIRGKDQILPRILIITICVAFLVMSNLPFARAIQYNIGNLIRFAFLRPRLKKAVVGLEGLFESEIRFLLGGLTVDSFMFVKRGIVFSDNSYVTIAIYLGVPLAIAWIVIVLLKMIPFRISGKHKIVPVYFWGTLLLNNAILWDIWLLYALGILVCSGRYSDDPD